MKIKIDWCTPPEDGGSCVPDLLQFRYFDDALNHENLRWNAEQLNGVYVPLAEEAAAAGDLLFSISMLTVAFEFVNMLFAVIAYVKEPPRKVSQFFFGGHIFCSGLVAFACWNFGAGL